LREARFPDVKTLDQIEWAALKGVARPKILELSSCDFIGRAEDVILAGPIGTRTEMNQPEKLACLTCWWRCRAR
jgi:hypothetical protein